MKKAVFCIAQTVDQAEHIVDRLKTAGFSSNDISVLLPDKSGTKDFAHEKHTKAPEGTAIGGTTGLGVGAVLGWLAGIGSLAIPEYEAKRYEGKIKGGNALISVHTESSEASSKAKESSKVPKRKTSHRPVKPA